MLKNSLHAQLRIDGHPTNIPSMYSCASTDAPETSLRAQLYIGGHLRTSFHAQLYIGRRFKRSSRAQPYSSRRSRTSLHAQPHPRWTSENVTPCTAVHEVTFRRCPRMHSCASDGHVRRPAMHSCASDGHDTPMIGFLVTIPCTVSLRNVPPCTVPGMGSPRIHSPRHGMSPHAQSRAWDVPACTVPDMGCPMPGPGSDSVSPDTAANPRDMDGKDSGRSSGPDTRTTGRPPRPTT